MYRIIDICTERALGGLRSHTFNTAWSYLNNLHTLTGKICWHVEEV